MAEEKTLTEELDAIKEIQDGLVNNKVAKFCYTDKAYEENTVASVEDFVLARENNIPNTNPSTLKVNETILSKGWRATASSITRMLMNHFLGRLSYNVNKVNDNLQKLLSVLKTNLGDNYNFATLDENGRIPFSQLPESAIEYQGNWNAETNTPALTNGMEGATSGDFYIVEVGGIHDFGVGEVTFFANDRVIYNKENKWERLEAGSVRKVNNKEPDQANGNVTVYGTDIKISEIDELNLIDKMKQYIASTLLGRHWLLSDETSDVGFRTIYYANGIWVAGSYPKNGLWYSTDGKHWLQSDKTDNAFYKVYYANGIWVAGGAYTTMGLWYSTDGQHWLQSDKTDEGFFTVYYANGIWVAGSISTGLWYSIDGQHWLQSDITTNSVHTVYYANGIWVAGSAIGLWYSTDGQHWLQSNKTDNEFQTVYYANGIWVAGAYTGTGSPGLWYSTDGQHWLQSDKTTNGFITVYYAYGIWVAGSHSATGLWYSTDGKHWLQSDKKDDDLSTVYYANGIWVAGSFRSGGLWYSTDGKHWLQSDKTNNVFHTVYYANGVWVAGGTSIGLWYSSAQDLIDNGWVK